MECREARNLLPAGLLEELDRELAAELDGHVRDCAACRADRDAERRLVDALAAAPAPAPSTERRASVVEAMARASESENLTRSSARWRLAGVVTIAAALLVVMTVFLGLPGGGHAVLVSGECRVQSPGGVDWRRVEPGERISLPARLAAGPAAPVELELPGGGRVTLRASSEATVGVDDGRVVVGLDRGSMWGEAESAVAVQGVNGERFEVAQGSFAVDLMEHARVEEDPDGVALREVARVVGNSADVDVGTGWLGDYRIDFRPEGSPDTLLERFASALEAHNLRLAASGPDRYTVMVAMRAEERTDLDLALYARLASGEARAVSSRGTTTIAAGEAWFASPETPGRVFAFAGDAAPWRRGDVGAPGRVLEFGDTLVALRPGETTWEATPLQ